jgi:hypothetical protein
VDKIKVILNAALAELFVWLKPSGVNKILQITALKGCAIEFLPIEVTPFKRCHLLKKYNSCIGASFKAPKNFRI